MARKYDTNDRLNAAFAYVLTGYVDQAASICGVHRRTLQDWVHTDWFQELIKEARSQKQDELDGVWTGIIHQSAEKVLERVKKGDPVVDKKTGEVVYIPVKAKDLAVITAILADKRALLRGQVTTRVEKITTDQRLNKIQEKLAASTIINEEEPAAV